MLAGLNTLLDNPVLLGLVLAVGAAIGIAVERFVEAHERELRRAYWRGRRQIEGNGWKAGNNSRSKSWTSHVTPNKPVFDAAEQLRAVMGADFTARPLLNSRERRVLTSLDRILAQEVPEWRAMCQVSLGEILASKQDDAFRAVNSKRVDFLVVDADSQPLGVIEYQGGGHHQGTAAARDAVKKEALRRASIDYYEISAGDTPSQLRAIIQRLAMRRMATAPSVRRAPAR